MAEDFGKTEGRETEIVRLLVQEFREAAKKIEGGGISGNLVCTGMAYFLMEMLVNSGYAKTDSVEYFTRIYDELKEAKVEGAN